MRKAWAAGIRPDPSITVSAWADAHRILPQKSSAEPGPWRTARTPYLREILDCFSATSDVEEVVLMKGGQLGGSEVILNVLGYVIDHAPGATLVVQPTVELGKRFSKQRIEPLVTETPRLAGKVADSRSRDSRSSMLSKDFLGGVCIITGANSAVGLRSMPARYLLLDELDGYPADVDGEGAPVDLAEARQRTFARRKTLKVSTPTVTGLSAIEAAYLGTDQRRYFVPCPHCGERQALDFDRLTWSKLGLPPAKAVYLCLACDKPITESHKTAMLAAGEWKPTVETDNPKVRGYHLSALYAPAGWRPSWGEVAATFLKVRKAPDRFRVYVNTVWGLPWTEKGEAPEWDRLYQRREHYPIGTVPRGGLFLVCGVDVQKDRLVCEIVAFGRAKESWSVDYGILPGNTADLTGGPWAQLDALLARTYQHEDGAELPIRVLACDSGYNTSVVYAWAKKYPMNRVIAVKGQASGGALIGTPSRVEITAAGRRSVFGSKVWPVSGAIAKGELYAHLALDLPSEGEPFPPGFAHFPEYDQDYFKQLTAEHLVQRRNRRGYVSLEWEVIPGRENHVLDCRVYARAAAALFGMDRFRERDWAGLENTIRRQTP